MVIRSKNLAPDFNRFLRAIKYEIPDRVPLAEVHVDKSVKEAYLGKKILKPADEVEFWYQAGYDYIPVVPEVEFKKEGKDVVATTAQQKQEEKNWADEKQGAIIDEEDFNNFEWPDADKIDYANFIEVSNSLPKGMKIIGRYGYIFTHVWELMGFEHFAISLSENIELVEKLFNKMGEIIYRIYKDMAELKDVKGLWYNDDLAYTEGLLINPKYYREYLFPWIKKIGEICKDKEMPFIMHSDGDISLVLEDIIDCGVTAIHPIEPKAMDILELREKVKGRLGLIGNIDLGETLTRGTPEKVEKEVREKIDKLGRAGGYCVGSSNSIPDYVPLKNYQSMLDAVMQYGVIDK